MAQLKQVYQSCNSRAVTGSCLIQLIRSMFNSQMQYLNRTICRSSPANHSETKRVLARSTTWVFVMSFASGMASASAAEPFEAFLKKHCIRCHGPQKEEGDIRIDRLSRDFTSGLDSHQWAEALDKVNSGDMPPEDEPQPTQDEIAAFVTRLDSLLKEGRAARMAARPAVAIHIQRDTS